RTATRTDVPVVPSAAVQRGPDGFYVYLVKPDQTVSRQAIALEQDDGALAVIASGLAGGESVVLSGQSRLTDGSHVSTAKPAG
ncbi:MAG: efflux RND transporter periplasmic adaptor subunit, partial [Pseudomonadota bacterium]|nr:efflux RND transporter periplasmic adaptor subunit [Pseudomonadota bacterium]